MSDDQLICIVEVPKGSRNKYEYDPKYDAIKLDRFMSASVVYPADYGYIPETLAPDGDMLDALVCVSEPTFSGCLVPVKPIALFRMTDEKGEDDTVVCVPLEDPGWSDLEQLEDLPEQLRLEIGHFFDVYKDLDPRRESEVKGWSNRDEALAAIEHARERYRAQRDG